MILYLAANFFFNMELSLRIVQCWKQTFLSEREIRTPRVADILTLRKCMNFNLSRSLTEDCTIENILLFFGDSKGLNEMK